MEHYAKTQGLWAEKGDEIQFDSVIDLDLRSVKPSMAGPRRPQDMVLLSDIKRNFTNYCLLLIQSQKIWIKNLL